MLFLYFTSVSLFNTRSPARDSKSPGAAHPGVAGLALPPSPALEAAPAAADQDLHQRRHVEAPAARP